MAKQGEKVCREVPVGIALSEWMRGTVIAVNEEDQVAVRIDEVGPTNPLASVGVQPGIFVWAAAPDWIPCY